MSSSKAFGDMLRRQRETRGIALRAVAEHTKIGVSFLTALERGDCAKWPGGIYSRAWIRAYASAVGLDPDDIAGQFAQWFSRTAFPEGEAPARVPRELPPATALRLTLAPDSRQHARLLARYGLFFVCDVLLALAGAILVSLTPSVDFWTAFAAGVLACHAIGLFGGGGSAIGWIDRSLRRHARPHDESGEAPVAEAA